MAIASLRACLSCVQQFGALLFRGSTPSASVLLPLMLILAPMPQPPLLSLALLLEAAWPMAMQPLILPYRCFSIRLNCLSVSPVTQRISSLSIIYQYHEIYLTILFVVVVAAVAVAIVTQIETRATGNQRIPSPSYHDLVVVGGIIVAPPFIVTPTPDHCHHGLPLR